MTELITLFLLGAVGILLLKISKPNTKTLIQELKRNPVAKERFIDELMR